MRARLMMKIMTLFVLLICTIIGARSCNASSRASPLHPTNVARNGLNSVCANQQAVEDAGGSVGSSAVSVPQAVQQELGGLVGGSLSCPTTTTTGP